MAQRKYKYLRNRNNLKGFEYKKENANGKVLMIKRTKNNKFIMKHKWFVPIVGMMNFTCL
jgi:hypothetical protein